MAVDMDQVRAALDPEEPDYPSAASKLGADALPHLETIITGDHLGLAAKAAYLAGVIGTDQGVPALQKAARSSETTVRIAAAAAAGHLSNEQSDPLLLQLVDDADVGVRKVALRSAPAAMSDALKARVAAAQQATSKPPKGPRTRAATKKSKGKKAPRKSARRGKQR